jgi:hypothetical protein
VLAQLIAHLAPIHPNRAGAAVRTKGSEMGRTWRTSVCHVRCPLLSGNLRCGLLPSRHWRSQKQEPLVKRKHPLQERSGPPRSAAVHRSLPARRQGHPGPRISRRAMRPAPRYKTPRSSSARQLQLS